MKFSLRTLLLIVTLIACYLAAWRRAWHVRYTQPRVWHGVNYKGWHYTAIGVPLAYGSEGYPWLWRWPSYDDLGYGTLHYVDYSPTSEQECREWLASEEAKPYLVEANQTRARWLAEGGW